MANTTEPKYYIKSSSSDAWVEISDEFPGLKILKLDGFNEIGDAVNVYNEQWQESQAEDFVITGESGRIIRKNVDLELTFICGKRYGAIDTRYVFLMFMAFITGQDFYIKSEYAGAEAHVVCLKGAKPTTQKIINSGTENSYIIATVTLHELEPPTF